MTEVEKELLDYVLRMGDREVMAWSTRDGGESFHALRKKLVTERTPPEVRENVASLFRERLRAERRCGEYAEKVRLADSAWREIIEAVYEEPEFKK